jgi:preprotein translocase subunit SecG
MLISRGSQGYRRHIGEGANSLGRARGQSNFLFPYNFLQKLRNILVDALLIYSFCYVIERSMAASAEKEVKKIVLYVYFYMACIPCIVLRNITINNIHEKNSSF